nr:MAG TPA: hypothetical protein [Caudoviricetes sp.]
MYELLNRFHIKFTCTYFITKHARNICTIIIYTNNKILYIRQFVGSIFKCIRTCYNYFYMIISGYMRKISIFKSRRI